MNAEYPNVWEDSRIILSAICFSCFSEMFSLGIWVFNTLNIKVAQDQQQIFHISEKKPDHFFVFGVGGKMKE